MQIAMIGAGYVGLVTGACFSEFGANVTCVDKDENKISVLKEGKIPIFEPGLAALVQSNVQSNRLTFTSDLKTAVEKADAVFIAVGTPSRRGDGHADLSFVFSAAEEIAHAISNYTLIVTKSTVPVGTGRKVAEKIRRINPGADFDVCSNPEFLREGAAINDFMRPDRVVIGADTDRARKMMREIYRPLFLRETPIVFTDLETSELTKYAANSFLAAKITFINEIADLCEKLGADVHDVAKGIGLDGRIGSKFLHPGPGYGGSCFPKDTLALIQTATKVDSPLRIVEAVVEVNGKRKKSMAKKIINACSGNVTNKTLAILGVTFKPNTDDIRDAPSLDIIPTLQAEGANINVYDPEGMYEAKSVLKDVSWCNDAYQAMEGADAVAILTEWNEFRGLDLPRIKSLLKTPIVIDLRNIYNPKDMKDAGFVYSCVGRKEMGSDI
ncbi:UDP-glucose/GDP-mannose dehydrogenase family protein [Rhodospirillaceae bacterium]|nr:UDP-glucose/GDP-mannose dehydrogenase family protein [Rhodospirillaceae bacterium]